MTTVPFSTLAEFQTLLTALPKADHVAKLGAQERNNQLTKPPGALGKLEEIAIWYASWRGDARPVCEAPQIIVFAGNHGVTNRGVSAFPAEVTAQMVYNFQAGGAAINQLASAFGSSLNVHALDLDTPTADFSVDCAMGEDEVVLALATGWTAVDPNADLLVTGEMGIGNTTSASAIATALFGGVAADWAGRGTGLNTDGVALKAQVISEAIALHKPMLGDPLQVLRCLGGRELAAMVGAIASARFHKIPVLLDGFICTAAAAILEKAYSGTLDHTMAAHVSAEQAHANLLAEIRKEPILSLGMRLGEGSGGALAIGILKAAVACHSGMATFAEAGVSDS